MKWRRRPAPLPDEDHGLETAVRALERALNNWPDVHETSGALRTIREENHLGERVHRALGGGK